MGRKSDRSELLPLSRTKEREKRSGCTIVSRISPRNLSDSGRPRGEESCYFRKIDRRRRGVPFARKTVLVAKKRIKIQALEGDPMVGWPSVRMNPDPRDKMEESKELSVSRFCQFVAISRCRTFAESRHHYPLPSSSPSQSVYSISFSVFFLCSLFATSAYILPPLLPPLPFPSRLHRYSQLDFFLGNASKTIGGPRTIARANQSRIEFWNFLLPADRVLGYVKGRRDRRREQNKEIPRRDPSFEPNRKAAFSRVTLGVLRRWTTEETGRWGRYEN